jgi:PAS domain S-box-containing protein
LREFNAVLERRVDERTETLRQNEERLRLMIEGVQDHAIIMLDAGGCVASWNGGAERMNGYRAEEIIGGHFSCFFPPDEAAAGRPMKILETALADGRFEEEGVRMRKDGSVFHAAVHLAPLYDAAGRHLGYVKITRDITARVQADEERRLSLLRTRFVEQVIAAREDEQRRLARELHDGIGQSLTSLRMALGVVERADDLPKVREAARELRPIVVRTEDEVRRLTRNLRPAVLDDLGLVPALSRLADEVRHSQNMQIRFDAAGAGQLRLPDVVETALYRIAQEALTNVVKHAAAAAVEVRLDCAPTGVQLTVADDGVGYDPNSPASDETHRFGIVGMRERVALLNGAFEIEGRPQGGTTILVTIPFPEDAF